MYDIRANLERAIELVEDEPDQLFSLYDFEQRQFCKTLHCTLGLCAMDQHFQEQGLLLAGSGVLIDGTHGVLQRLDSRFGEKAFPRLFEQRGHGAWDHDVFDLSEMDDKDLALYRLRRQLEELTDEEKHGDVHQT